MHVNCSLLNYYSDIKLETKENTLCIASVFMQLGNPPESNLTFFSPHFEIIFFLTYSSLTHGKVLV